MEVSHRFRREIDSVMDPRVVLGNTVIDAFDAGLKFARDNGKLEVEPAADDVVGLNLSGRLDRKGRLDSVFDISVKKRPEISTVYEVKVKERDGTRSSDFYIYTDDQGVITADIDLVPNDLQPEELIQIFDSAERMYSQTT